MKNTFSSESGMTIIEVIAAMVILVVIVAAFSTVFSFAGTSVFTAGHDAASNADGRTEADNVLAGNFSDFSAGSMDADTKISWRGGAQTSDVSVAHVSIDVPTVRGPDGDYNLFRRPETYIPAENPEQRRFPHVHRVFYDYNGGTRLVLIEGSWDQYAVTHYNEIYYPNNGYINIFTFNLNQMGVDSLGRPSHPIVRPGFLMLGWYVSDTGETIDKVNFEYDVHRSLYLKAIWECTTCARTDCNGH